MNSWGFFPTTTGNGSRFDTIRNESRGWMSRHWKRMAAHAGICAGYILRTLSNMAARIIGAEEVVASEQQSTWGKTPIISRIMEVIVNQAKDAGTPLRY